MSEADKAMISDDLPLHLPPEALKQRIRTLVHDYAHRRSARIAQAVVRYSEALSLHPALRDQPDQLQAFCRLKWHWRMLAAQCPALAAV